MTFKEAFREIKRQTGYNFLWGAKKVNSSSKIWVELQGTPLTEAIQAVLKDMSLDYEISEKTILIKESTAPSRINQPNRKNSGSNVTRPQNIETRQDLIDVKGKLRDSLNNPIAGASIRAMVGGEFLAIHASSLKDGSFVMHDVPANAHLRISSVGYQTLTIKAAEQLNTLTLKVLQEEIGEIVVTGIFERPAQTYTGAVNSISAEDIRRVGNQNVLDVLSILDPSIHSLQDLANGSDPNNVANLRLRGASSLPVNQEVSDLASSTRRSDKDYYNAYDKKVGNIKNIYTVNPNLPLFVLDGFEVPIQRINDIDIHEIKSIVILKDASATAIYGSRGANGVIVFERIRPAVGEMLHDYDLLNASEKLQVELMAGLYNRESDPDVELGLRQVYNERLKEVLRGRDTYWPSIPLRNAFKQKHRINMEGGAGNVTYGINFTYNQNNGVMKGSSRSNYNGGLSLSYRGEKFLINNQLNVQFTDAVNSPWGSFAQYVRMNPYFSPYDTNGNITLTLQDPINNIQYNAYGVIYNPVYNSTLNGKDFRKTRNLINNTALTYKFTPNLTLRGRISVTSQDDDSEIFLPASHTTFRQRGTEILDRGAYTAGYGKMFSYDGNLDLNYNFNRGPHQLYSTLSARAYQLQKENVMIEVNGLPSPLTDYIFYGRNYVKDRPGGSESTIRTVGFLGNINYAYNNRYLFDFSYRLDGASSVGADRLFAPFWSAGLGWNLHQENFFRGLVNRGIINQLRLRGSIGITGAQQFDSYMALRTYNYELDASYLGSVGAILMNIGNEDLTWQATRKSNIGLDLGLLHNRLQVNADYYADYTDKFLADFNLPLSTGFQTYKGNLGAIRSRGAELRASYQVIQPQTNRDFGLMLMGNIGTNSSIIDQISEELKKQNETLIGLSSTRAPFARYEEGASLDAIWVVPSLGIDPATGQELYQKIDGSITYIWDAKDMISAGVSTPKYRGTLGFNLSYQGFQFNAYLTYRYGSQLFNQTLLDRIENVDLVDNADKRVLTERWQQPGDQTFFKSISIAGSNTNASSRFLQGDNSLDMTSASLLYRFSDARIKRLGLRNLTMGFYMNDVFRISSIQVERGLDYPFARNFSLSLQTSF
jgi:TonB-linked SusC/RagA family outer membrane protein